MIVKLTEKELETIRKGEAEAKQAYEEANAQARALRPEAPEPPYKGAKGEDIDKVYEEWERTGSKEWRDAYRKAQALFAVRYSKNSIRHITLQKADDRLLKRITKSQNATVKELKRQADFFLQTDFIYKNNKDAGVYEVDFDYIHSQLEELFFKPMQTLDEDHRAEIENYIDLKAGELPPTASTNIGKYSYYSGFTTPIEGTDSGERITRKNGKTIVVPCDYTVTYYVPREDIYPDETTEGEKSKHTSTIPKDYLTTMDRVSKKAFTGGLIRPLDADSSALWDVRLDSHRSKTEVIARVAIDYKDLIESGAIPNLPELTEDDYDVHDAIISHINAGNYAVTKTMLYRVMSGKMRGTLDIPDDIDKIIEDALLKFQGKIDLEYHSSDKDGNELKLVLHEPIVTYIRGEGYLNGTYVDDLIIFPEDGRFTPPLLKWARFNHNEIDTRDVTLLDVKGLNNGRESRAIKMCLYRRVISMKNIFERKYNERREIPDNQRSIRYDYVYSDLKLDSDALTKDKRHDIKTKIDRCMSYWKSKGLIADYKHKKDKSAGNAYYAVEVSFMPQR